MDQSLITPASSITDTLIWLRMAAWAKGQDGHLVVRGELVGWSKADGVRPGPFHAGLFKTLSDVKDATMAWVDWYNHRRLQTTLGMRTPAEHEAAHHAALHPEPQPV